jgi:hypothetical protein
MDTLAAPVDRKFHPVVNDDPQNAHLNVQTPGADINQTVVITQEPGPDGQVIPAGDTKVASCVTKDAGGDIDLSGGGSCASSTASAPIAVRAAVTAPTIGRASSPSRSFVPSLASASVAQARNTNAPRSAPNRAGQAVETVRAAAPLPAHRTEIAQVPALSRPGKQLAPAVRADAARTEFALMRWLEIGLAAALLLALGLWLMFRMGLGDLLLIRGRDARLTGEERTAPDGRSAAAVHDPLPSS